MHMPFYWFCHEAAHVFFQKARYEIMMDTEMDHYIPDYKDKWLEMKENGKIFPFIQIHFIEELQRG